MLRNCSLNIVNDIFMKNLIFFLTCFLIFASNGAAQPWTYLEIDNQRQKWGDWEKPEWLRYFGLDIQDVTRDGYADIVAGRYFYRNPGNQMEEQWERIDFGFNMDGLLFIEADDDPYAEVIALALPNVYLLQAQNLKADNWSAQIIGHIPATDHVNSQGYTMADIVTGGKPEVIIAGGDGIYYAEIPDDIVSQVDWNFRLIAKNTSGEGIGSGDIDGDGDIDLAAGDYSETEKSEEPNELFWYENPGDQKDLWKRHKVTQTAHAVDRVKITDINGDQKPDIVVSEERHPGPDPDASLYWFERTENGWTTHVVSTQYSLNNMDVGDVDADGDIDISVQEHKNNFRLQWYQNDGNGNFEVKNIDDQKEGHLGARLFDLDNDGDLDVISTTWENYRYLHVWRNDRIKEEYSFRHLSSANGDFPNLMKGDQQTALLVADLNKDNLPEIVVTERTEEPSVVCLYNLGNNEFEKVVIDNGHLRIEAGSTYLDVDEDGDIDIIFAGEGASNEVWWWENPYPGQQGWKRHIIKNSGATKHHDIMAADVDNDGKTEIVFWNQGKEASAMIMAEIPDNPAKHKGEWPMKVIYDYHSDSEMEPAVGLHGYPGFPLVNEHEGLAYADIDLDGMKDIVGGGHWFKYKDREFLINVIDASYQFTRSAVGQFIPGGRPEVILTLGDGDGPMFMYQWHEWEGWKGIEKGTGTWKRIMLDEHIHHGHSLEVVDFNKDGIDDIFVGEMSFEGDDSYSRVMIYQGLGDGTFKLIEVAKGIGIHEGRTADLDNDGDLDIVSKPYNWKTPRLDLWINESN